MAQWNVVLQPMTKLLVTGGITQDQEVRFALPSAPARNITAWINVSQNNTTSTWPVFKIYGATSLDLSPDLAASQFWLAGVTISLGSTNTGSYSGAFANPPAPYLRWQISAFTGVSITFEIILMCWDI